VDEPEAGVEHDGSLARTVSATPFGPSLLKPRGEGEEAKVPSHVAGEAIRSVVGHEVPRMSTRLLENEL
jgi:hypothetical protein